MKDFPGTTSVLSVLVLLCGCGGGAGQGGGTAGPPSGPPVSSGSNSIPAIQVLSPSCAPAGEPSNQLTVVGLNFVAGSVVRWNGSDRPTTSNGSINGLTAQISASDVAAAGTAAVTVFNPGPGGGSSNASTFTITTGAVDPQSIAMDLPESSPMWRVWAALAALVATCPCTRSTPPPGPWRP
jgi:hypothetical protein